ncbi:MAG: tetratricopeptide repeat protein [Desulfobulbaceae bacterium]|nr:tetratricopeptide repeat protein [Desulfobulbaceae bacterium]
MAQDNGTVKLQTMVVAIVVALAVGFIGGVIYSSMQQSSPLNGMVQNQQATGGGPPAMQEGQGQQTTGLTPQQASTILSLEQRVASNPNDADAWVQLGNTYFDTNNFSKSIAAYNHYLTLQPNNANVLTDLGIMYRNNGEPSEAIASFDRAIAVDPKHVQAPFNKGIVLMNDMHDHQAAIDVWQKLVDENPGATASNGMPVSQVIEEAKKQMAEGKH